MIPAFTLANLAAYALQLLAIVFAAGLLAERLRLAPHARLWALRVILLAGLLGPIALIGSRPPDPAGSTTPAASMPGISGAARTPAASGVTLTAMVTGAIQPPRALQRAAAGVIAAGAALRLLWLLAGAWRLRQMRRAARPWTGDPADVRRAVSLTGASAQVCDSPAVPQPVTYGYFRPIVLLPPAVSALDPPQQSAVLCHELLHVRRGDWLETVALELLRAMLWFHPAVWWIADRIHLAREQVVDQAVVALTTARYAYVDALLTLATSTTAAAPAPLRPATPWLRRRHLTDRVTVLLREVTMPPVRQGFVLGFTALLLAGAATVSARLAPLAPGSTVTPAPAATPAAARPAAPPAAPSSASPAAPAAPAAPASPAAPPAASIPPGQGAGRGIGQGAGQGLGRGAGQPQFTVISRSIPAPLSTPAANAADNRVILDAAISPAGSVTGITPVQGGAEGVALATAAMRRWQFASSDAEWRTLVAFNFTANYADPLAADPPAQIAGNVAPPKKTYGINPQYPAQAMADKVQGVVVCQVTVGPDGRVGDAVVLQSTPALDAAALDSVMQWEFTPPVVDGALRPVTMRIVIKFTLRE